MKNAHSGTGRKVPPAPPLEYDVIWHGAKVSASGEKGQLLPETHDVSSTWTASVNRLKSAINAVNKRHVDG
jgi:hypothetical protein